MWGGFSAAARDVIANGGRAAFKAVVVTSAGATVDITYAVTGGSVTEDETAAVRRTCTLTLNDPALVPAGDTDLLHPLSGNELVLYRGVWVEGAAAPELAPLGVFRLSKPAITDDGTHLAVTVNGKDRSSEISRRAWTGPYTAAAGQTVPDAIQAIINSRWTGPALTYNMAPSTLVVPAGTTFGVQYTSWGVQNNSGSTATSNDPWQDCVTLAKSAGCELLFDRSGVVVMRPVPEPNSTPVTVTFQEGASCKVTTGGRDLDTSKFYNGVIVIATGATQSNSDGSSSPAAPVTAAAWSTDPQLGPNGPLGERPDFILDQVISTQADAQAAADAQLPLVMAAVESTSFEAAADPSLDAGDCLYMYRQRMQLNGTYIASAVTHPFDVKSAMSVTNRSYTVAVGQNLGTSSWG